MGALAVTVINFIVSFVVLRWWRVGGAWKRQLSLAFVLANMFSALHAFQGSMLALSPPALSDGSVLGVARGGGRVVTTVKSSSSAAVAAATATAATAATAALLPPPPPLPRPARVAAAAAAAALPLPPPAAAVAASTLLRGAGARSGVALRPVPNAVARDGAFIQSLSISPFPASETVAGMVKKCEAILTANPLTVGCGISRQWGMQIYNQASLPLLTGANGWTSYVRETDTKRAAAMLKAQREPQPTSDAAIKAYLATFSPNAAVAVLVHCGPSLDHGWHSLVAIDQLRRVNPNVPILWMLNAAAAADGVVQLAAQAARAQIVHIETLDDALAKKLERVFFVSGDMSTGGNAKDFNLITTKRLFYVRTAAEKFGLRNIFHIENDNMVYVDLNAYLPTLAACTVRLATTVRELHNVRPTMTDGSFFVLGFMYIRDEPALRAMLEHFVALLAKGARAVTAEMKTDQVNDMSLAAHYFIASVERKGLAQSLDAPITILPEQEDLTNALGQQRCIMQKTPLVFDNAAIAIWHFGNFFSKTPHTDQSAWGAYSRIPAKNYDISWEAIPGQCRRPVMTNKQTGKAIGVGSLHVHSKQLKPLLSTGCPGGASA